MFDSPLKDGLIILVIVLLFFGPKRLPALSRAIGASVREFRGGIAHGEEAEDPSELASAPAAGQASAPATDQRQPQPAAGGSEPRTGA